jgi:hypothetical protein
VRPWPDAKPGLGRPMQKPGLGRPMQKPGLRCLKSESEVRASDCEYSSRSWCVAARRTCQERKPEGQSVRDSAAVHTSTGIRRGSVSHAAWLQTGTASQVCLAEAYATEVTRQPPCGNRTVCGCCRGCVAHSVVSLQHAPTSASLSDSIHPMYLMYSGFPKSVGYL